MTLKEMILRIMRIVLMLNDDELINDLLVCLSMAAQLGPDIVGVSDPRYHCSHHSSVENIMGRSVSFCPDLHLHHGHFQ